MAAPVLGYRAVLVVPDNYGDAKQRPPRADGAEVAASDSRLGNNAYGEKPLDLLLD
jgi:cysteine synthase A